MNKKVVLGVGLVMSVGLAGSALAANITIGTPPNAGQGTSVTAGYNVTGVKYFTDISTTNADNGNVNKVDFNLYKGTSSTATNAGSATKVWVQLRTGATQDTGKAWAECTAGTLPAWSCTLSAAGQKATLSEISGLAVAAYD